jgi:predicted protein tyrosine phosphatase
VNVLFVCNQGLHRSRTAAELFKNEFSTRARGLYGNTVTDADMRWAEMVIVMEDAQRKEIGLRFPKEYLRVRIACLGIPDRYSYDQPELRALLLEKMRSPLVEL